MSGDRRLVVTTPPPTPNGPLHLGHLSGPYVAGDVAIRAARAQGHDVLALSGLDSHQNYVPARALQDGTDPHTTAATFGSQIRQALEQARIGYDVFLDPLADETYRKAVKDLLGTLKVDAEEVTLHRCADCDRTMHHAYVAGDCGRCGQQAAGGACEQCGALNSSSTLKSVRCGICGGPPTEFRATVPVLALEDHRAALTDVWSRAVLPPYVRGLIAYYLTNGLPEVPLAYPSDWGIETDDGLRIDVWVEMALGYLHTVAATVNPEKSTLDAWQEVDALWQFHGVDNTFYYAFLIPAVFDAAGLPPGKLGGLVVNEFYRLTGAKFSTSRNHAVWALDQLATDDPGTVREYLAWDRPDTYQSDFTPAGYEAFKALQPARLPEELKSAEQARTRQALKMRTFDLKAAVRGALATGDDEALRLIRGE